MNKPQERKVSVTRCRIDSQDYLDVSMAKMGQSVRVDINTGPQTSHTIYLSNSEAENLLMALTKVAP